MPLLISILIVLTISLSINPVTSDTDAGGRKCDIIDQPYLDRQPDVVIFELINKPSECNWRLVKQDYYSDDCFKVSLINWYRGRRGLLTELRVTKHPSNCSGYLAAPSVNLAPKQQLIYYGDQIDHDNERLTINCCSAIYPYNGTLITIETNDRLIDGPEVDPTPWFLKTSFIVTMSVLTVMCSFTGFLIHSIKIIIREQNAGNMVV